MNFLSNQILDCPSSTASYIEDAGTYLYETNYCDYVANTCYMADMYGASTLPPYQFTYRRMDTVAKPSSVFVMADGHENDQVSDYFTLKPGSNYWDLKIGDRHNSGTNLLFLDNHAERLRLTDFPAAAVVEMISVYE